ncbi:hypothetical protein [Amycolatopsis sp. Hca4]|uniref:hypothetical protein n=1 Tax=Amycolatopsis sp. Hca4 TaxID=2742131 RepID=UPI0015928A9D|nr:hypothetical protein [Amycolatopsis sp. Hca4]QKV74714.1 hypothetical protein HUT10_13740 [Amycolatopsis sp. Hca4]
MNNSLIVMFFLPVMLRGMRYAALLSGLVLALRGRDNATAAEMYGTFTRSVGAEPIRRRIAGG